MILFYFPMALASALFALLTWVLAPLLALLVHKDGNLPSWLYWFQTFDATCDDCRNPPFNWTGPVYWTRLQWLWRNPAYGFDLFLLGYPFTASNWHVVSDTPTCFFAYSKWGAFSYRGRWFKWGWKAWARLSGVPGWTQFNKVPIVVLR